MRAVLLLSCADQKGLVASVSDFIYRNDGSIVDADQHTDFERGVFLQRIEWEMEGFRVPRAEVASAFRPIAERFGMSWELRFSDDVPRVAIFVSKLGHCLEDLLWRHRAGELRADVPLVLSNHEDLRSRAAASGVPFHVEPRPPAEGSAAERDLLALLSEQRIDV